MFMLLKFLSYGRGGSCLSPIGLKDRINVATDNTDVTDFYRDIVASKHALLIIHKSVLSV